MAQAGFPWSSQSRDTEKEPTLPEGHGKLPHPRESKQDIIPSPTAKTNPPCQLPLPKKHGNDIQGRHGHGHLHGHGHRHGHGSIKGPSQAIQPTLQPSSDHAILKATSPLPVRTIPPWLRDAEEDDLDDPQFHIPDAPNAALVAQHNHSPSTPRHPSHAAKRSHDWDGGFVTASGHIRPERTSRWVTFARSSIYPRENFNGEKVDADYLNEHFTDYSKRWLADHEDDPEESSNGRYRAFRRKRQVWYKRAQYTILRNPFIPLAFRLTIFIFAFTALGLGTSIYHESNRIVKCINQDPRTEICQHLVGTGQQDYYQDPSGLMAMIVDIVAVMYIIYITYDEYFSKPLGLRPARAKVRLVLLDLFFVIFQSANLALSFESLTVDEGACKVGDAPRTSTKFDKLCDRAEALSAVLLVSLTAWLITFSISVLRLVERIETK